jgi:aspartate/methionine/tyrosine aminotransferase
MPNHIPLLFNVSINAKISRCTRHIHLDEKFTKEDTSKLKFKNLKLIIYSNPSNPTGYVMSKEQLELLAELAEANDAYLISDEIYELFDYDKKFLSVGSFYEKSNHFIRFFKDI